MRTNTDQAVELGLRHQEAGQLAEAESIYRQVLARVPRQPHATHFLGVLLTMTSRADEGLALLRKSVELRADPMFFSNYGAVCRELGRIDEAIVALQKSVAIDPQNASAWNNLGLAFLDKDQLAKAESHLRQAIALNANYGDAYSNLGVVLLNAERLPEAESNLRRAIELNPQNVWAQTNLANMLAAEGRANEADQISEAAVRNSPREPQAHLTRSHALLLDGRLVEGWEHFEWRRARLSPPPMELRTAPWDGSALGGKAILLYSEQGFGDTIQFVRYARMVADRGGRVILRCQAELVELLKSVPAVSEVVSEKDALPAFDVHCPLLSLPRVFKTDLANVPADVPYVSADDALVAKWNASVRDDGAKLRIGLAWAGNPTHERDRYRSCALTDLAALGAVDGAVFYSLQKGARTEQAANPSAGMRVIDRTTELTDFSQTAGLVANLDVVVCVDTAVAHLAGAMGKPVLLMLSTRGEWRWLRDRTDSPWYPTMRILRQTQINGWHELASRVAEALRGFRRE